ncbi:hypothetical protein AB0471_32040, partial [Streptomyces sp. NPDC052002]|uniref:hypothetical protein n=1 Tax=Streptomyces sp. NPDC052002 TaxID=3155754 RepID=UPI00344E1D49
MASSVTLNCTVTFAAKSPATLARSSPGRALPPTPGGEPADTAGEFGALGAVGEFGALEADGGDAEPGGEEAGGALLVIAQPFIGHRGARALRIRKSVFGRTSPVANIRMTPSAEIPSGLFGNNLNIARPTLDLKPELGLIMLDFSRIHDRNSGESRNARRLVSPPASFATRSQAACRRQRPTFERVRESAAR